MSILRIYEFQASEGHSDGLHVFLKDLMAHMSQVDGCLDTQIYRGAKNSEKFVVIESWASQEHHEKSFEHFPKEKMQAAKHLFGGPPQGDYFIDAS